MKLKYRISHFDDWHDRADTITLITDFGILMSIPIANKSISLRIMQYESRDRNAD